MPLVGRSSDVELCCPIAAGRERQQRVWAV